MPFLLGLAAIAGAVIFWMMRARDAGMAAQDLADMANDVRLAARRFGFRRKSNVHPVESVDESAVIETALSLAVLQLNGSQTIEERKSLQEAIEAVLRKSAKDAEELMIFGGWLIEQCGTTDQAVSRLARKSRALAPQDGFFNVMDILKRATADAETGFSQKQNEAIHEITRCFGIK